MSPERYQQIGKLYHQVLEMEPGERGPFLAQACGQDQALRNEVESLVSSHDKPAGFLDNGALLAAANLLLDTDVEFSVGQRIHHYEIVAPLGAGGMGEVFLADDTKMGRKVALKLLPAYFTQDQERVRRFKQEAQAVVALNHPNIVTIYDVGQSNSIHFIATELIEGETLRRRLTNTRVDLSETMDVAIQVTSALVAAHRAGILHRDIKPENIMLRADGYVKVLDFGLAKLLEKPKPGPDPNSPAATRALVQTDAGAVMGTISYMSPEQARGAETDARTDIWSLGVVVYEMAAGRLPFEGKASEVIARILEREPAPLARYAPELPAELERIVAKALTKNVAERYQTAKDLLNDLKKLQQRLQVESEIERVRVPEGFEESPSDQQGNATSPSPAVADTKEVSPAFSFKYVVKSIERHKLAAVVALLILVASAAGLWWYFYFPNAEAPIDSIAVLPFVNASGNDDLEYLSDGLTESLIISLAQLPNLKVFPRASVFRYKGKETDPLAVGKVLGVRAVLTGRLVQHGDTLEISAELIDVRDNKQVWGAHYSRKSSDLLSLQSQLARDVSNNLRIKISGADESKVARNYTANAAANELYLRGRFHQRKDMPRDLETAVGYFQQAITLDSHFAKAYAGLALAYAPLSYFVSQPPRELMLKAKEAALHAISLDDQLVEAHTALGYILFEYDYDFAGGEREFKLAIELNPNDSDAHQAYGELLTYLGRHEEARAELQRALEIDPFSLAANCEYGGSLAFARQYDEAIGQLKRTLEQDTSYWLTHYTLAITYDMKGDYAESVAERIKINELFNHQQEVTLMRESFNKGRWSGFLRAMTGKHRPPELPPYIVATFYVELGEKDKALAILNHLYEDRSYDLVMLKVDPRLDPLRDDPSFQDLTRRVGFTQ